MISVIAHIKEYFKKYFEKLGLFNFISLIAQTFEQ